MKRISTILLLLMPMGLLWAQQTIPNFNVTDVLGQNHRLYEDYLNNGKTVVIKFFFTTCPPCIANAPLFQQKYVQWGSGNQNVEFFSFTTLQSDNNAKVLAFKNTYGQTMHEISQDGNASQVVNPFKSGTYGSWWGTPSFVVIAPNKTFVYPVFFNEIDAAITAANGTVTPLATEVQLDVDPATVAIPDGHVKFYISPKGKTTPKIEILKNNQGSYVFTYPSATIPEMEDAEITMQSVGPALTNLVTPSDMLEIQKHILEIKPLTPAYKLLAADVNNDSKVSPSDLLEIRKLILGITTSFPNNKPAYFAVPSSIPVLKNPGNKTTLTVNIVKTGNVN